MNTNPIFDAAIDALHKRPEAVLHSMQDFVKPYDHFEDVAKVIYTGQMGLCELIEYLRAEFGGPEPKMDQETYQKMLTAIQDVR